ncbi:MAG: hypothetical protein KatS3mg110_4649 [Pirellulaceae bacterium]|nr:MAG: hypothetical protein KatS3mg110_4649 [Pirellulaceae bacterium]
MVSPYRRCDGVTRRDLLQVGALGALGLTIADWLGWRRVATGTRAELPVRARSCILIWLDGGPSHLDLWDLKPDAPEEVRGPFRPIATNVPGVQICEHLPLLSQRMHQLLLVRSMTSPLGEHNLGTHYMLTGYKPSPVLEYATFGAWVSAVRPANGVLPSFVAIPDFHVGGGTFRGHGFLPPHTGPFSVSADPARPDFRVPDLEYFPGVTPMRLERRRVFAQALDRFSRLVEENAQPVPDPEFEQAYRMVTSAEARRAFDLSEEPDRVRDRYGRRTVGQACLLARRLVERGVPFVTVNHRGWDTHQDAVVRLRDGFAGAQTPVGLIPSLDRALAALLDDLAARGLLDETLVLVMGEFGRTPKVNTSGGRDHWPRVFSLAMAGAGIPAGGVVGSSDAMGESPKERPITPADLAATVLTLLGIDPSTTRYTSDGRPVRAAPQEAQVIREIVAS